MNATKTNLCRLCINVCQDYQLLRDENGSTTRTYEIAAKYFDAMFLNVDEGNQFTVMCSKCWQRILDFFNFQQYVVEAQKQLLNGHFQHFETTVKSEVDTEPEAISYDSVVDVYKADAIKITTNSNLLPQKDSSDNEIPNNCFTANHRDSNASEDITDISSSDLDAESSSGEDDSRLSASLCEQTSNSNNIAKSKPTEVQKHKELDKFISQHYSSLECVICSTTCTSYSLLQQHFRHQHPMEKCHIFCCERRLGSRFQIEEHLHLHNDPNAFQCVICYKSFSGRYSLYSHVYAEHRKTPLTPHKNAQEQQSAEEKSRGRKRKSMELDAIIAQWKPSLECLVCTHPLPNFSLLRQHYRQQHPNEECYIYCCGRKFNDRSKLGEHVHFHVNPNVYKCELCDARHNCKRNLYFHIRTYHPQSRDGLAPDAELIKKPPRKKRCITITSREIDNSIAQYRPNLECDLCSEICSNFTHLKTHFRLHHPSIAFYIQCCQRRFNNRSEFENHLRLHVDPNAFKCELCGKCLSSIKKLRAHKGRMHFNHVTVDDNEDVDVD